jgi:hypothetical protein
VEDVDSAGPQLTIHSAPLREERVPIPGPKPRFTQTRGSSICVRTQQLGSSTRAGEYHETQMLHYVYYNTLLDAPLFSVTSVLRAFGPSDVASLPPLAPHCTLVVCLPHLLELLHEGVDLSSSDTGRVSVERRALDELGCSCFRGIILGGDGVPQSHV